MAKRRKLLPARRREAVDESVLIRSAETLGRVIGSLQRQLDDTAKRFSGAVDDVSDRKSTRSASAKPRRNHGENGSKPARAKKTGGRSTATRTRR